MQSKSYRNKSHSMMFYLLVVIAVTTVACGMRKRTSARTAPDDNVKNETVFKTNEEAVKAGVYEEFTDSMVLKGSQPASKVKENVPVQPRTVAPEQRDHQISSGVTMGFRVQLAAFNDQQSAEELASRAKRMLPGNISVYVRYYAPYWKVHAGDCGTRSDAERLNSVIKRNGFPDAWIVSAGINR